MEGSAAAKAGIQVGDIVTKLADTPIDGIGSLRNVLSAKKAGDTIKVELKRGEETLELEVVLGISLS